MDRKELLWEGRILDTKFEKPKSTKESKRHKLPLLLLLLRVNEILRLL
jgi:hypothetical protein